MRTTSSAPTARVKRLADAFRAGHRPALARAISMVEARRPGSRQLLRELLRVEPRARRFGVTGPPGAGKSSLLAGIASCLLDRKEEVAIVAVDPTSPFSGGALLGDRIRMNDLATDPGMFVRSMATRGSLGGLAASTRDVVDLLDAFGFPTVMVETVGVGQTELEIASATDTVAVVLVPESGDGIQAMKAGLMEIADLFVVNKSDRVGADRLIREIRQALHLRAGRVLAGVPAHHGVDLSLGGGRGSPELQSREAGAAGGEKGPVPPLPTWEPPVLKTSAGRGEGIDEFLDALLAHNRYLARSGTLNDRRKLRAEGRIRDALDLRLRSRVDDLLASNADLSNQVADVAAGRATADGIADELLSAILRETTSTREG